MLVYFGPYLFSENSKIWNKTSPPKSCTVRYPGPSVLSLVDTQEGFSWSIYSNGTEV